MKKKQLNKRKILIAIIVILFIIWITYTFYSNSKVVVCIDAGHGGSDVGAINEDTDRYEKDDTLKVAKIVKNNLKKHRIKVVMTRSTDKTVDLEKRCDIANNKEADLFVSIHRNSSDSSGNGIEIWVESNNNEKDKNLANNILDELDQTNIQSNRGVKEGTMKSSSSDYYVNENTNMASCLIELGFITDNKDNKLLDENMKNYGKAISDGIVKTLEDMNID